MKYATFDALLFDVLDEYERGRLSGLDDEQSVVRCAALISVHRDDLASLQVSFGVAKLLIRLGSKYAKSSNDENSEE